jgi:glycerol-3-phosphate acyltransferase PlsY
MTEWLPAIAVLIGSYLAGSVPFGLWVTKAWSGVDIREVGSGNIGTTNVLRAAGWRAALVVFVLDASKGAAPALVAKAVVARGHYGPAGIAIVFGAGALTLLGHAFSVFLRFRGGRGVATGVAVLGALCWQTGLSGFGVFVVLVFITRIVSVASIAGAASMPFFMLVYQQPLDVVLFAAAASAFVIARHAPNIKRLLRGEEHRIGRRSKGDSDGQQ